MVIRLKKPTKNPAGVPTETSAAPPAVQPAVPTPPAPPPGAPPPKAPKVIKLAAAPPAKPRTLAQLHTAVGSMPGLTEAQRKAYRSAINTVAKIRGLPASQISADVGTIRGILQSAHPAQLGITRKRMANLKSDLKRAMECAGLIIRPPGREAHSAEWRAFMKLTPVKQQAWGISRLAVYCSLRGIAPHEVTDAVLPEFRRWLDGFLIDRDPHEAAKSAGTNYNAIVKRAGLGWPLLDLRRRDRYLARPIDTYPASFKDDLDAYLESLANPDYFDDGPDRALKPVTLRNIGAHMRQLADAAVTAGVMPEAFNTLSDLVRVEVIKRAIPVIQERTGKEFSGSVHNILSTALNIARHWARLPEEEIEQIAKAKARVAEGGGYNSPRLSMKNKTRLAAFEDEENYTRLLRLPEELMAEANKNKGSQRAALDAMAAVAMAILEALAIRAKNLAELDLERHVSVRKKGRKVLFSIFVPMAEVKNRADISGDLSEPASKLIREYLTHHHPVLAPSGTTALFPRPDGRPRDPGKLGELVQQRIRTRLGLQVHAHLFRHIAAQGYLNVFPGEFESVRRLLGHAKMETTTGFYAPLSNKAIQAKYHGVVLSAAAKGLGKKGKKS